MNKMRAMMLIALASLCLANCGQAEVLFDGTVIAGETQTITAPFGGTLQSVSLREGQWIDSGERVAAVETTKVYAGLDGTIRGLFTQAGDSVQDTVLYIAPISKYTINASIDSAYSSINTKYVVIGETVYIKCTKDGSHQAVGTIIAVNEDSYTVETTRGELYMEEKVYLYRSSDYDTDSRIGSGTVARTAEVAVKGTGSLLALYVEEGDIVERGQLIFETVEGTLDQLQPSGRDITSPISGVIATISAQAGSKVEKGTVLATIYPQEGYLVEVLVPEDMLSKIGEGDVATLYLYSDEEPKNSYEGSVLSIGYTNQAQQDVSDAQVQYAALIKFDADSKVRLGMSVSVSLNDD